MFANMQVVPTDYGPKSAYIGGEDDDQRQYEHEYECECSVELLLPLCRVEAVCHTLVELLICERTTLHAEDKHLQTKKDKITQNQWHVIVLKCK